MKSWQLNKHKAAFKAAKLAAQEVA